MRVAVLLGVLLFVLTTPSVVAFQLDEKHAKRSDQLAFRGRVFLMLKEAIQDAEIGRRSEITVRRDQLELTFESEEDRRVAISKVDEAIAAIELDVFLHACRDLLLLNMRTGQQGLLLGFVDVIQVLEKDSMIAEFNNQTCLVTEIDTSDIVDDEQFLISSGFKVTGTETYPTAIGGTNTVWKLKPIDLSEQQHAALTEWEMRNARVWTSSDGKHTRNAALVKNNKGSLTLLLKDGSQIEVDLKDLSAGDRNFVQEWTKKRSAEHAKAIQLCVRNRCNPESILSDFKMEDSLSRSLGD